MMSSPTIIFDLPPQPSHTKPPGTRAANRDSQAATNRLIDRHRSQPLQERAIARRIGDGDQVDGIQSPSPWGCLSRRATILYSRGQFDACCVKKTSPSTPSLPSYHPSHPSSQSRRAATRPLPQDDDVRILPAGSEWLNITNGDRPQSMERSQQATPISGQDQSPPHLRL
jgi:hypothetical protein